MWPSTSTVPGYHVVTDLDAIPRELRGLHPDNPVNRVRGGGTQLELSPRLRGISPRSAPPDDDGLSPPTSALIQGLVAAAHSWEPNRRLARQAVRCDGPSGNAAAPNTGCGTQPTAAPDVPALYRTRITHLRRAPVHHYFEHRSYSWYVDVDDLPQLPRWLRPFARIDARGPLRRRTGADTLRARIDAFLASRGVELPGGTITALLQARVLGYVYNPLSLYWCHDARRLSAARRRRGAQHPRWPARISVAA